MKAPVKPKWSLSQEQCDNLRRALGSLPADPGVHDPQFLKLLELWEAVGAPWNHWPTVKVYRARGGDWVHGSVGEVVRAIKIHLEAGA